MTIYEQTAVYLEVVVKTVGSVYNMNLREQNQEHSREIFAVCVKILAVLLFIVLARDLCMHVIFAVQ